MKYLYKPLSVLVLVALAACASVVGQPPITPGQSVQLQPGEGIAALLMDTYDPVSQVRLESPDDKNPTLVLPSMPAGRTLALFEVPAGIYCLKQFNSGRFQFHSKSFDVGCFHVTTGHISYSGDMVPTDDPHPTSGAHGALTDQQYQPTVFLALLKQQYPQLMAAYPTAGPSSASEGGDQNDIDQEMATWFVEAPDHRSYDVFFRNNTNWDLVLTEFDITTCDNLKQPCGKQAEHLAIPPNTTIKLTTLEQADQKQSYQFQYEYNYDRAIIGDSH